MDPLTDVLDAPRARHAFLLRVSMAPPWAVRVQDRAPLTVVAVVSGAAAYAADSPARDGSPSAVELTAGDVLLVRGPDPYLFADNVDRVPQAVIHPGGRCETPTGESLALPLRHGVRSWGNAADGPDTMLIGTYESAGEVGSRILDALPRVAVLRGEQWRSPLVGVLADEIHRDGLGQSSLLDRLLDALVVAAVREWFATPGVSAPPWVRAGDDPVVRDALALLHDDPTVPWSVATLAREVGVSRAALAKRFAEAVGEPPIGYLTGWRLALAADRLRDGTEPVSTVSRAVGYTSPFTFSTAFKRRYGVSPLAWRRQSVVETA